MGSLRSVGNSLALPQSPLQGDDSATPDPRAAELLCNSQKRIQGEVRGASGADTFAGMANNTTGTPLKNTDTITKIAASAPPENNATSAFKQKNGKADVFTRFIKSKKKLDSGSESLNQKKKKRQKEDLSRGAKTAVMKAIAAKDTADTLQTIAAAKAAAAQEVTDSEATASKKVANAMKAAATKAAAAKMKCAAMKAAAEDAKQAAATAAAEANAAKVAVEAEGVYADLDTKDAAADDGSSDDKRKSKSKKLNKHRKHKKISSEKDN
ncbi:hypothetical protein GN958_ATG03539 [Phytophthora infestans]|uniref:Uncharacterized protein n=2 Tax=Phytophthora infestans TaxID=4787 RepID=A0A8S9V370_PHYIN|nr:hypothetical protein GN958_ATG03539 [Phytophthora infestans]